MFIGHENVKRPFVVASYVNHTHLTFSEYCSYLDFSSLHPAVRGIGRNVLRDILQKKILGSKYLDKVIGISVDVGMSIVISHFSSKSQAFLMLQIRCCCFFTQYFICVCLCSACYITQVHELTRVS